MLAYVSKTLLIILFDKITITSLNNIIDLFKSH